MRVPLKEEINVENYDLGIIGGGPGGYVAAIRAAQLGRKIVLFEKEKLGGTCLNRGCIPTKTLLQSVKTWRELQKLSRMAITGVDLSEAKIDIAKLQQRKNAAVMRVTKGVAGLLKEHGVQVIQGRAVMEERPDLIWVEDKAYQVRQVIIATGSRPRRLPLPGIDSSAVITSDEALSLEEVPSSLLILGGGVIGVEFALIFRELGAEVTIIEMEERLLPHMDEEIAQEVARILKSNGIVVHTGARAIEIKEDTLFLAKAGETKELNGEKILVSVGRTPCYEGIDVEKLGLKTEKGAIITDEFLRTSVPQIYAIGDVNGKYMLAHKASAEALVAVENILGQKQKMDYRVIPQCVYSFPEIASVGLTEKEAREKCPESKVGKFPLAANGKAQLEGETKGFVKVIIDDSSQTLLGVHLCGVSATELIAEAVTAMKLGATVEELVKCIHPHPTISEAVQEAYYAAEHGAIHFWQKKMI
ncbi:MAG: dihydrolipoyl dehydrogenase [Clostridia bacterium]|nr:dihydrolipoyl dehydrogenase [Clostridia bacterium]